MDNTSIITQVANPKEEESIASSPDKGKKQSNVNSILFYLYLCVQLWVVYAAQLALSAERTCLWAAKQEYRQTSIVHISGGT